MGYDIANKIRVPCSYHLEREEWKMNEYENLNEIWVRGIKNVSIDDLWPGTKPFSVIQTDQIHV